MAHSAARVEQWQKERPRRRIESEDDEEPGLVLVEVGAAEGRRRISSAMAGKGCVGVVVHREVSDRRSKRHVKLCKRRHMTHGSGFALRASRIEDKPSKSQCSDQLGRTAVAAHDRASTREGRG
eukprot:1889714-Pleurochrysis_carterae.AAC.1